MHHPHYPDPHHDVASNTLFGFWIYLMTDCVLFGALFASYAVLHNGTFGGPTAHELFDLPFTLVETLVLLTSSFTCGLALIGAPHKAKKNILGWLGATFFLGVVFMVLELSEFRRLIEGGNTWQSNAFLSSYFTLIGTHGLHILIGLMMLVFFGWQLLRRGLDAFLLRRLACMKMYWHFLYLIWIFTFTIVYLVGS
jgi:cytochrome o ubiquinol oxidase subunit 3